MAEATEATVADLSPLPKRYLSSRGLWDLLLGEDPVLPVIAASSTGDIVMLQDLLSQPTSIGEMLQQSHTIYHVEDARNGQGLRSVLAMRLSHIDRTLIKAAQNRQGPALKMLIEFALQHGVRPFWRQLVREVVFSKDVALFEALMVAGRALIDVNLGGHHHSPLRYVATQEQWEMMMMILRIKPREDTTALDDRDRNDFLQWVLEKGQPGDLDLLLQNGFPIGNPTILYEAEH